MLALALRLLLAFLGSSCTALHWTDASGAQHHLGLVTVVETPLARGTTRRVLGLGIDLDLVPGGGGLTLGVAWDREVSAFHRSTSSPGELTEWVVESLQGDPRAREGRSRWRFGYIRVPPAGESERVVQRRVGSAGARLQWSGPAAGIAVGYAHTEWIPPAALAGHAILLTGPETAEHFEFAPEGASSH